MIYFPLLNKVGCIAQQRDDWFSFLFLLGFYQLWPQLQRNATHPCFPAIAIFQTLMHLWDIFNRIKVSQRNAITVEYFYGRFLKLNIENFIFYPKNHIFS